MLTEKQLNKLKIALMVKSPFLSTILFNLKVELTENIPTAGTNGIYLHINPVWLGDMSVEQQLGLIAHECYHVVFNHMARGEFLNGQIYNIAGDHVINLLLLANNYKLPPKGCHDKKYTDWTTMQVYDDLMKNVKTINIDPDMLDVVPLDKDDPGREHIKNVISQAVIKAKMGNDVGHLPGHLERQIEELLNPKLPWNNILQNYMSAYAKEDYRWAKPNRKYLPDYYLPSQQSEAMGKISVAIDTSASVSQQQLTEFLSEVNDIFVSLKPSEMEVITFDTRIQSVSKLEEGDDIDDIELSGGGGTRIKPVFNHFMDNPPEVAIIFTDGEFSGIKVDPEYDIIWIIYQNDKFCMDNIGETIYADF